MATRKSSSAAAAPPFDLDTMPGHYIRRLQQIAVAIFLQETADHGITPVQYAALQGVANHPDIDQRTLARTIGFDTSTIGGVVDRLEARGLLARKVSPEDRRARLLTVTAAGQALLRDAMPAVQAAQEKMLDPLSRDERAEFVQMLKRVVAANNEFSRAPSEG